MFMSRLESVIAMLRALPEGEQEAWALQIESVLQHQAGESVLTDEQWAEVEREIAEDDGTGIPHEEVMADMKARFG